MPAIKKPRRIALVLDLNEYYTRTVAVGIRKFFRNREGWSCEMLDPAWGGDSWDWILDGKWDGIIAYALTKRLISFLQKCGIPSVNVSNSRPPLDKIPRVVSDDYAVGQMVAEHFLERGLRHFAHFGNSAYAAKVRQQGFEDRIKTAGFHTEKLSVEYEMDAGHWLRTEITGLPERIAKGDWPLGVFCYNDAYARFAIRSCVAHKFQVPEQVAVVGVNNSEVSDGLAEIPFSSVELPLEKIGYTAMELLSQWIETKKRPDEPAAIPPLRLVMRRSSDLIAVNDEAVVQALRLIREGALGPIDIREVVKRVGVSRRILEKRFKDATGRTPYAEVLRLRVDKAKALLAGTDLRISEVAEKSGFTYGKQLHVIFTRHTGMPPSIYRKKYQTPR